MKTTNYTLDLPWPPSVNKYWHRTRNGRTYKSRAARDYSDAVAALYDRRRNFGKGRIRIDVIAYPPDRRRRDIDNLLKGLCDSLEGVAFDDDSQIDDIRIRRGRVIKGGLLEVMVTEIASKEQKQKRSKKASQNGVFFNDKTAIRGNDYMVLDLRGYRILSGNARARLVPDRHIRPDIGGAR